MNFIFPGNSTVLLRHPAASRSRGELPALAGANHSLSYRIDSVEFMKADDFCKMDPQRWAELMQDLLRKRGHPCFKRSNLKDREKIAWAHPRHATSSQITDLDLD
jgi:hypothetical protein